MFTEYQHRLHQSLAWWTFNERLGKNPGGRRSPWSATDLREGSIHLRTPWSSSMGYLIQPIHPNAPRATQRCWPGFTHSPLAGVSRTGSSCASVSIRGTAGIKPTVGYDWCHGTRQSKFNSQNFLQPYLKISCSHTSNTFWERGLFIPWLLTACLCAKDSARRTRPAFIEMTFVTLVREAAQVPGEKMCSVFSLCDLDLVLEDCCHGC